MNEIGSTTVITVDGLAGVGKSTVARKLANKLGFVHLNSGALFRATAFEMLKRGLDLADEAAALSVGRELRFEFSVDAQGITRFTVNGEDVSGVLSREDVSIGSSKVAVHPRFRELLVGVQREVARKNPVVLEGRDAGTVVFPDAPFKFFLEAALDIRAKRRFDDLAAKGVKHLDFDLIKDEMKLRDERDTTRNVAPTVKAADAVAIDTSGMDVDAVVEKLLAIVNSGAASGKKKTGS